LEKSNGDEPERAVNHLTAAIAGTLIALDALEKDQVGNEWYDEIEYYLEQLEIMQNEIEELINNMEIN